MNESDSEDLASARAETIKISGLKRGDDRHVRVPMSLALAALTVVVGGNLFSSLGLVRAADLERVEASVAGLKQDVGEIKTQLDGMTRDGTGATLEFSHLKRDVQDLRNEIVELRRRIDNP